MIHFNCSFALIYFKNRFFPLFTSVCIVSHAHFYLDVVPNSIFYSIFYPIVT